MNEFYIDPVLYTGRPADCTDRLAKEVRTYDLLDKLAIPYSRIIQLLQPWKIVMTSTPGWILQSVKICFSATHRKPISTF